MDVTATLVFLSPEGGRRGLVCVRPGGRYQVVTESTKLFEGDDELYWYPDWPPSGVLENGQDGRGMYVGSSVGVRNPYLP